MFILQTSTNSRKKRFKEVRTLRKYMIMADNQVEPLEKSNNIGRVRGSAIVQT